MSTSLRSTFIASALLLMFNGVSFANVHMRNTEEKLLKEVIENAEMEKEIFSFLDKKMIYVYDYEGKLIMSGTKESNLDLPVDRKVLVDTEDTTIFMAD
ncbi:hypothetical protein AB9P05_08220 [Roseivirga sp. BDSF3-8]|uniref:hypothetical protein n=1 Tax=Roseivirga sp. BDSF3-8 TaxID=3241598 RepID=UPI0035321AFD